MTPETLRDKRTQYRGRAKVYLKDLQYQGISARGKVDAKHVDRLVNVFQSEGCSRLHVPENAVPAIVSSSDLDEALSYSGLRRLSLMQDGEPPFLYFPAERRISVLHGEHRLRAADQFFKSSEERWWVVTLYSNALQESTKDSLREEYAHALKFSDGDIYRSIRFYERSGDSTLVNKWKARLSERKAQYLSQLGDELNKPICSALDRILPFIGLWDGLKLGAFCRILPLRCPEVEFSYYLEQIYHKWSFIMGDESTFALLDTETVVSLETLTPKASFDASRISTMMNENKLFPAIHEAATREDIMQRLLSIQGRIPSFATFIDDSKCMEAWVKSLRPLITSIPGSFRTAMLAQFRPIHHIIQTSSGFQSFQCTASSYKLFAYIMLFLAAMRDFPVLARMPPRQTPGGGKPMIQGCYEQYQAHIAQLALDLGCMSNKIHEIVKNDPDYSAARGFINHSRPSQLWEIDEERASALIDHIVHELRILATRRNHAHHPEYVSEIPVEKRFRSGLPNEYAYKMNREYLYIDNILSFNQPQGLHLTFFKLPPSNSPGLRDQILEHIVSDGSSNYDTATIHSSQPVSNIPDYRLSLQGPYSTRQDGEVQAVGFEQGTALSFHECHILTNSERLSVMIHDFLLNPQEILVIYIWSNCCFAKFWDNPESKLAFNNLAAQLADSGLGFVCIESNRVTTLALHDLWEVLQQTRILFAGPKSRADFPVTTQYDDFLDHMEGFRMMAA
ncbi:hypothetical protein BJX63DRAFT_424458 [Aspergillus granulosus]|uniref:ParB/Sulfiredoxin domain-containing protein n=1 Tax=Aspergillus granulosus TaxID=176169 RepID=A0ABR4GZL3_9EURO